MKQLWSKIEKAMAGPAAGGWALVIVAGLIGSLAALVAVAFDALVRLSEGFFFGRVANHEFDGWKILLLIPLPALGGLAVGLITYYLVKAPPGHGIPDVIEALARRNGTLRARSAIYKMITASLSIGSGGSAGQEGPIVQIGSVVGSFVARHLEVSREHRNTLVGCGAAAGLAALFNAPIAGVIFVLEVILRDFSMRTFLPVVVAAVMGVATSRAIHPEQAMFSVPAELAAYPFVIKKIIPFIGLGVICGLVGWAFARSYHGFEHWFRRLKLHPAVKPAIGGLLLGMMGVVFVLGFGRGVGGYEPPVFFANGYPVIQWLFHPSTYLGFDGDGNQVRQVTLLVLLAAMMCKIIGTGLTLGSGGSGGTFAPSLFIGATLGGAFGIAVRHVPGFGDVMPANFALVGMAGVLAGTVHCPLTAFLLVFELTNDYKLILPVMLVAVLATTIAKLLDRDSIYTTTLREQGIRVGAMSDLTLLRRLQVTEAMVSPVTVMRSNEPAQRLLDMAANIGGSEYVVVDDTDQYLGVVRSADLRLALMQKEAIPLMLVGELARNDLPTVKMSDNLEQVMDKFSKEDVTSLPVIGEVKKVLGVVTRAELMRHYLKALEEE